MLFPKCVWVKSKDTRDRQGEMRVCAGRDSEHVGRLFMEDANALV